MPTFDILFSSYRLNALNLPNRVVMAPMSRYVSPGGVPTAEVAGYYRRRAEKGVGLIITEGTGIDRPAALNDPNMPQFHGGRRSPAGKRWWTRFTRRADASRRS
jgi:2,4-dienoyl-CoA reductase-like NADH-dependent reductase (Old Yellow Enzyme family)